MEALTRLADALTACGAPTADDVAGMLNRHPPWGAPEPSALRPLPEPVLQWDEAKLAAAGLPAWWAWVDAVTTPTSGGADRRPILPVRHFPLTRTQALRVATGWRHYYADEFRDDDDLLEKCWPAQLIPLAASVEGSWGIDLNHPEHGVYKWWLQDSGAFIDQGFDSISAWADGMARVIEAGIFVPTTAPGQVASGFPWDSTGPSTDAELVSLRDKIWV